MKTDRMHRATTAFSPLPANPLAENVERTGKRTGNRRRPKDGEATGSLCRVASAWLIAVAVTLAAGSDARAETPSPKAALSLKPVQKDAVYQLVESAQIAECEVRDIDSDAMSGWEVTLPDGTLLRRFADTNNDKKIDLWSYFNFGVEAYRDIDSDYDGRPDQYRWLGNTGTRWGLDQDENTKIDLWKRISAEEVSAELIAALATRDVARFVNLLPTKAELDSLGLGDSKSAELTEKVKRAAAEFESLAGQQTVITPSTKWIQFAAPSPGLVPAGTDGSTQDIEVYENVVAMFERDGESGQLMVGTLVRIGDVWRAIDLPNIGSDGETLTQSGGFFFTPTNVAVAASRNPQTSDELQELVTQLESIDTKLATAKEDEAPQLHETRADLVEKLIASSGSTQEKASWTRQLVDTVSVAIQTGHYPKGLGRLKRVAAKFARNDKQLAAYANYQAIQAEYVAKQVPDADFEKVQIWYLDQLTRFVDDHAGTAEAAQAMLQLALGKEFEDKEREALVYYRKVRDQYKGTDAGEKAAGAVRRLESVGRRIELEGRTVDGKAFRLSSLRGRPTVIHYWATWCEPCKQDMKLLERLQSRYRRAGLTLVGINVDASRDLVESYLKENKLPWIQLFQEGGLESSPLAKAFGVQTLPTMMLIDKNGTVVRHNVRAVELAGELEEMIK